MSGGIVTSLLRVLILEDDPNDAELIRRLLADQFVLEVTRVQSKEDFDSALKTERFDLILAECRLGSCDGLSALAVALDLCSGVPFIFVTGTAGEDLAIEGVKRGASDYVLKTRLTRLVPCVQRALREAAQLTALRRSQAYLAEAERQSHSGAFAFDANGSLYWSEGLYRIWGFDPGQGVPSRMWQRVHPDDWNRFRKVVPEALRNRRDFTIEFRIVLPDGTIKHVRSIGHPSYSDAGDFIELVGITTDVTEAKRAEEEHERLRQLEADFAHLNRVSVLGELTASLAHEILHPIASARNNARAGMRFLEMSPPNMHEVREALACVVKDADRGKDIVDRIREHIRKAPPRRERFDLNAAITEVVGMVQNAIDRSRVSVRISLLEEAAPVVGDRVQLQQVVLNLVLNALEAMSSLDDGPRQLFISTMASATAGIVFAVHDTGPGLAPEQIHRLFKPFYTTKPTGLGMGLSICRSIVDAHGGKLWAEPNDPRGAVFRFTLPATAQAS
ncbi:MAG: PAS domain-containing protein [Alphaproteobacteria bacterium]|nr:PAS domain-containing protein [Alphaproteobacteria bacterium]